MRVKKYIVFMLVFACFCTFAPVAMSADIAFQIHISPSGNDLNDGTLDNPVQTFERAREIYRNNKNERNTIYVHGGVYRRSTTFILNSDDSNLKIKSYGDKEVSVRGSVNLPLCMFSKVTDDKILNTVGVNAAKKLYSIKLDSYMGQLQKHPQYSVQVSQRAYYELYVNSQVQTLARWPNYGWELTKNTDGNTFLTDKSHSGKWMNSPDAMAFGYWRHNWACQPIYIASEENGNITLSKAPEYGLSDNMRYYIFNTLSELNIPGEYYIDTQKNVLYYYPIDDFSKNSIELTNISVPLLSLQSGADNIEISGITFEYTRDMGITASNSKNTVLNNIVVRNTGSDGISMKGTYNSTVKNSRVYNTGGKGIDISAGINSSRTAGNAIVTNNLIYNFGRNFRTYQAGISLDGFANKATYNTVHTAPHCAVRFGGSDNIIANNEFYNVVYECSDSGAIYTGRNWTSWGNQIKNNYFHDIIKNPQLTSFTVSAVYIDDMSSGTTVSGNVFQRCTQAALFGGGKGNVFLNNKLTDCENAIDYDDRAMTGNWAHESVVENGTVYEGFKSFISSSDFQATKEEWLKYQGFSELMADIKNYTKNSSFETGAPKNVSIYGNVHYGKNTSHDGYMNICNYILTNGLTGSEEKHSESLANPILPPCSSSLEFIKSSIKTYAPIYDFESFDSNVEFVWNSDTCAYNYKLTIYKDSQKIKNIFTQENGYTLYGLEVGDYTYQVSALLADGNTMDETDGKFSVKQSIKENDDIYAYLDFEDVSGDIASNPLCNFIQASGDTVKVIQESNGNHALLMERNSQNLYSGALSSFALNFKKPCYSGKITVSYDMKLINYRGNLRDAGTVKNSSDNDIVRLLSHSEWIYGVNTSGYNYYLSNWNPESFYTVKRIIDLDNGKYDIEFYKDNKRIEEAYGYSCQKSDAVKIVFSLGYQAPYEPYGSDGNAKYLIDNIRVDRGEISPVMTYPRNGEIDVDLNNNIQINWNSFVKDNPNTQIYCDDTPVEANMYTVSSDQNKSIIEFKSTLLENKKYTVRLANALCFENAYNNMTSAYEFSFFTKTTEKENAMKVQSMIPKNLEDVKIDSPINILFNCNVNEKTAIKENVKLYSYGVLIPYSDYSVLAHNNTLVIELSEAFLGGCEYSTVVSSNILPENTDINSPMNSDFSFDFKIALSDNPTELINCDFSDWNDGVLFQNSGTFIYKDWTFVLYDGDSVSVETNRISGSKALKIVKGASETEMKIFVKYTCSADNAAKVSFDTLFENHSRNVTNWGSALDCNDAFFLKLFNYERGYWHNRIGDTKRYLCWFGNESFSSVEQILYPMQNKYVVNTYENQSLIASKQENTISTTPQKLLFSISNAQNYYIGKDNGDGIYWIDNVKVMDITSPKVTKVRIDKSILYFDFNVPVCIDSIGTNNVSVTKNLAAENNYLVYAISDRCVAVEIKNNTKLSDWYSVTLDNISDTTKYNVYMAKPYAFSGNIQPWGILFDESASFDGRLLQYNVTASSNCENANIVTVVYTIDGKIEDITVIPWQSFSSQTKIYENKKIKSIEFYLLGGNSDITPLSPKIILYIS